MIQGVPEMDNDIIDQELREYLGRMHAVDQVEMKLNGIIKFLKKRIDDDEPTIDSIFKVHRDSQTTGQTIGSLIDFSGEDLKESQIPGWLLERQEK